MGVSQSTIAKEEHLVKFGAPGCQWMPYLTMHQEDGNNHPEFLALRISVMEPRAYLDKNKPEDVYTFALPPKRTSDPCGLVPVRWEQRYRTKFDIHKKSEYEMKTHSLEDERIKNLLDERDITLYNAPHKDENNETSWIKAFFWKARPSTSGYAGTEIQAGTSKHKHAREKFSFREETMKDYPDSTRGPAKTSWRSYRSALTQCPDKRHIVVEVVPNPKFKTFKDKPDLYNVLLENLKREEGLENRQIYIKNFLIKNDGWERMKRLHNETARGDADTENASNV